MIVEQADGKKEILIDSGSFAAGYRQAVLDMTHVPETSDAPSLLPIFLLGVIWCLLFWRFIYASE